MRLVVDDMSRDDHHDEKYAGKEMCIRDRGGIVVVESHYVAFHAGQYDPFEAAPAFERRGGEGFVFEPVSYTHLDVYKRQVVKW